MWPSQPTQLGCMKWQEQARGHGDRRDLVADFEVRAEGLVSAMHMHMQPEWYAAHDNWLSAKRGAGQPCDQRGAGQPLASISTSSKTAARASPSRPLGLL